MERRSYRQFCGLARALDVVGERWTLPIVRNLLLGPRRYSDLLAELPGLTTNLLAKRLRELEQGGLIERVQRGGDVARYQLTATGAALEPVVMELARWGGRYMDRPRRGDRVDLGWALLSLKRRYRGGANLVVGLEAGDRHFELGLEDQHLRVLEREPQRPDLVLRGSPEAVFALFFEAAATPEALDVDGPPEHLEALLASF
jgi:DNA-binding HxlR family transcriptional regulator